MFHMKRAIPVRIALVLLAVGFVVFNSLAQHVGGIAASDMVVMTLLGIIGTAIVGDTARPSGVVRVRTLPAEATPRSTMEEALAKLPPDVRTQVGRLAQDLARRREEAARGRVEPQSPSRPSIELPPGHRKGSDHAAPQRQGMTGEVRVLPPVDADMEHETTPAAGPRVHVTAAKRPPDVTGDEG